MNNKNIRFVFFLLMVFQIYCCKLIAPKQIKFENDEGVFVEKIESLSNNQDTNPYNIDNKIYIPYKNTFVYNYYFVTQSNDSFKIIMGAKNEKPGVGKNWQLIRNDSINEKTVNKLLLKVRNRDEKLGKDYDQTPIEYKFIDIMDNEFKYKESTGVIENEKNIWMHPPRSFLFRILELNPFPFIQKPYKVGNKWSWELKIGDFWGDEKWITWKGNIINKMNYKISEKCEIITPFKKMKCLKINAVANSSLGKTFATFYFNEEYGFVKFEYINIDGTKLYMTLDSIIEDKYNKK